jgi:hypothetical protein
MLQLILIRLLPNQCVRSALQWVTLLIAAVTASTYNYQPPLPKNLAAYVADVDFYSPDSRLLDSGATNLLTADLKNMSMHLVYEGDEQFQVGDGTSFCIHHFALASALFSSFFCFLVQSIMGL